MLPFSGNRKKGEPFSILPDSERAAGKASFLGRSTDLRCARPRGEGKCSRIQRL